MPLHHHALVTSSCPRPGCIHDVLGAPLVCISAVMEFLAVWWHNKPKTNKPSMLAVWRLYNIYVYIYVYIYICATGSREPEQGTIGFHTVYFS